MDRRQKREGVTVLAGIGGAIFGEQHNNMLLTLERRLQNLKRLREKVERG
jgi:hypothetical protein